MKKYIFEYVSEIDSLLERKSKINDELIKRHLIKISFFNHERLIHLIVTASYGTLTVLGFMLSVAIHSIVLFIIPILLMFFLIPYIIHYFHLENSVQYMYKQYDKMLDKTK